MSEAVGIQEIEAHNFKRLIGTVRSAVNATGLTIIGGKNGAGKTSFLDAVAAALGGRRLCPTNPIHDGQKSAEVCAKLDNGMIVTRRFTAKTDRLIVEGGTTDGKTSQAYLDSIFATFCLRLDEFLTAKPKARVEMLLCTIGVDLAPFDRRDAELRAEREAVGRDARRLQAHFLSMPYHEDVPSAKADLAELMQEQRNIEARNTENAAHREEIRGLSIQAERASEERAKAFAELTRAKKALAIAQDAYDTAASVETDAHRHAEAAKTAAPEYVDESTEQIRERIATFVADNAKIEANAARELAQAEHEKTAATYTDLTEQIEANAANRLGKLTGATMPIAELGVAEDQSDITYQGQPWDCIADSEQLTVAAAVGHAAKPSMRFVLVNRGSEYDTVTLAGFDAWLRERNLQAIMARVEQDGAHVVFEAGAIRGEG